MSVTLPTVSAGFAGRPPLSEVAAKGVVSPLMTTAVADVAREYVLPSTVTAAPPGDKVCAPPITYSEPEVCVNVTLPTEIAGLVTKPPGAAGNVVVSPLTNTVAREYDVLPAVADVVLIAALALLVL